MYGYIYLTTNLINGHKYIGQHRANQFEPDKYIGSGKLLVEAISKYGRQNFKCELIEVCNSNEELNEREIYWIAKYDAVKDDDFYNIAEGGDGHTCEAWNKGLTGCYEANENQLAALERGRHLPASDKLKTILSNYRKTVVVSDETREKLSKNQTGRKIMNNGIENKYAKPEQFEEYLANGWVFGQAPKDRSQRIAKFKATIEAKKIKNQLESSTTIENID